MKQPISRQKLGWLMSGLLAGVFLAQIWPHEPAMAVTTDRDSKFALTTCDIAPLGTAQGIFVLDFLTGQLRGAVLNSRFGKFTHFYFRNMAADFNVDPKAEPHYAIVTGTGNLPAAKGVTPATGVVYVAELTSGKVVCYSFPYQTTNRPVKNVIPMLPLDSFSFREALQGM